MNKNALACSSHNTMPSNSKEGNSDQFIESGGKYGRRNTYKCLNGKIIKTSYENTACIITYLLRDIFKQIFLPVGFPESVSDDYISYQKWDTAQAFCSTITGTFTTQSILKSVGVGDVSASALGAAITWIIKDGSGMGGRIFFTWWQGNSLDSECKFWRLFADILNDVALAIEFTLPWWSLKSSLYPLCITSTMKSIVGVAGGATRAAITQHQAIHDNMGDISAKDGSQETCVNLLASICGIFLLTYFERSEYILTVIFILLTSLHIYANYQAVQSLVFKHLNNSRFIVVFKSYLQHDAVATPTSVNKLEPLFGLHENVLTICGFTIKMGSSLKSPFKTLPEDQFNLIRQAFKGQKYIIIPDMKKYILYVAFDHKLDSELVIRGYFHAVMLGLALSQYNNIPLNMKTKRQLHHVTPIQRLTNMLKKIQRPLQTRAFVMFPLDDFISFNDFMNTETTSFFTALTVNNWELSRNSLKLGEWRCNLLEGDTNIIDPTAKKHI